jgi:hypothetical protein
MRPAMRNVLVILILLATSTRVFGAVGCTLNDPDRDIKRLFPDATNYRTEFISIQERGGKELLQEIEQKLGDKFEPIYESMDVPYAYYTVLRKKKVIGYVHGVNQKGTFGGMQLILATDIEGLIVDFYFQKITSPEARLFRDRKFTGQFKKLSLKDFYTQDMVKHIKEPGEKSNQDYLAVLRGLKKNLIMHDEFMLNNKYDKYYKPHDKERETKNEGKEE